jgi:hypothetical protein
MTRKEAKLIKDAIDFLCSEDGFHEGMNILQTLLNKEHIDVLATGQAISYIDACSMFVEPGEE